MTLATTIRNRYSALTYMLIERPRWTRIALGTAVVLMLPAIGSVALDTLRGCPLGCRMAMSQVSAALSHPESPDHRHIPG